MKSPNNEVATENGLPAVRLSVAGVRERTARSSRAAKAVADLVNKTFIHVLVIADDDSFTKIQTSECADVLISCGDLTDPSILKTAEIAQCSRIFAVKGNHDGAGAFPSPIIDLHLRTESFGGLTFGGFHGSWRYKPRGHFLYDQDEVAELLAAFPQVDVFIAHNSPRHIHDRDDDIHIGFEAFVGYIRCAQPRLFFHGHQHINQDTCIGETRVIGVYGMQRFEIKVLV